MTINDESILAALLIAGSVRAAANTAGVSESTVRNRLQNPDFRAAFESAKSEILQSAVGSMISKINDATSTICELMNDKEAPASVRVSAADAILRHTLRYVGVADIERRLQALEAAQDPDNNGY